ncbi:MAG: type II toxin-antitoxin system RelE/ParE family toxin [Nitrospinae bacterium]|nr:type II toxin-antitoxin system RelE/ParE family toxin [Nitrospinota bacterium]
MKIFQSRSFGQRVKKLSKKEKETLDLHIRKIAEDISIGEQKKSDLKGVFVYKFKLKSTQYLLAYRKAGANLELIMLGPHENYYRDLKNYLKDS